LTQLINEDRGNGIQLQIAGEKVNPNPKINHVARASSILSYSVWVA
jgi:hypothetical protein